MSTLGKMLLLWLIPALLPAAEKQPAVPGDYVRIAVRGALSHGVAAVGGETTGTTISADGMTFELDLGDGEKLLAAAKRLNGKKAVAVGRLSMKRGVEVGARWIIKTEKLATAKEPTGKGASGKGKLDLKQLKQLLARAAGVDAKVIQKIATSPTPPKFSDFENQTLTAILFALPGDKDGDPEKSREFHYEGPVKPQDLLSEIYRAKRLGPLKLQPEFATFLQEDRITDIQHRRDGDTLRGTVSFRAPGVYAGKADFVAKPRGESWRIEEFSLPAHGIRIRVDSTGKWKLVEKGTLGKPRVR